MSVVVKKDKKNGAATPEPINTDYNKNLNMTSSGMTGNGTGAGIMPAGNDAVNVDTSYAANGVNTSNANGGTPSGASEKSNSDGVNTYTEYSAELEKQGTQDAANEETIGEINDLLTPEGRQEAKYSYIDQTLMNALGFNEMQYQLMLDQINTSKETGMELAKETRDKLLSVSKEMRDAIYKAAEASRERAYKTAEIAKERGVVDARSAYEQNRATYGANAEALAGMGLTGSGYSDHLDAAAYATQRNEIQSVKAREETAKREADDAEEDKKFEADLTYSQNVQDAENEYGKTVQGINITYNQGLADANLWKAEADQTANQTAADSKFAADLEYAEEKEFEKAAKEQKYAEIFGYATSGKYTETEIRDFAERANLDPDIVEELAGHAKNTISKIQSTNYNGFISAAEYAIQSGDIVSFDWVKLENARATEDISEDQYYEIIEKVNEEFDTSETAFIYDGVLLSKADAEKYLKATQKHLNVVNGWALEQTYNKLYTIYSTSDISNYSGVEKQYVNEGTFKISCDGTQYSVKSGGEVTGELLKKINNISSEYKDHWIFGYDQKIYIRFGEKTYEIIEHPSHKEDYKKVRQELFKTANAQ